MRFAELEKLRAGRGDVLQHRNGLDVDRRGERQRVNAAAIACVARTGERRC